MSNSHPVHLPFWVLMPEKVENPAEHAECGTADLPIAFSTTPAMSDYLAARGKGGSGGSWGMRLVTQGSLMFLIADLHQHGSRGVCLDPEPDGSGGTEIPLSELMKLT
jgi:hypothetical protein